MLIMTKISSFFKCETFDKTYLVTKEKSVKVRNQKKQVALK